MRAFLPLLTLALLLGIAPERADAEQLTLHASLFADFRQLFQREPAKDTVEISATLDFPDERRGRHPAVVIVHTLGGYLDRNEGWHAAEFRKAGFATLTYDSPAARSMRLASTNGANNRPPWASALAEAYAALAALAADPRIDVDRIAIVGFSFGGEVAHLAAFERLRFGLAPEKVRFAAHVAYYPAGVYGIAAEPGAYASAPILMLLGDKDDNLPIAKAQEYFTYARTASPVPSIDVSIYPGAYHAWTVAGLGGPRFYPQYPSTRRCPYLLLGPRPPSLLVEGREQPFNVGALQTCMKEGNGYTMAYDEALRAKSTAETVAFLRKHLGS